MERRSRQPDRRREQKSPQGRLEKRAVERLAAAFEHDGWEVVSEERADLLCSKGPDRYAIEMKVFSGRARRAILRAFLADAILQARAYAAELDAQPLAILVASSISDEIAGELGEYVEVVGGEVAWGVIDDRRRFDLHGSALESVLPPHQHDLFREDPEGGYESHSEPNVYNPFSDLGQWMLKVLLAADVPPRWLNAPRADVRGVSDLARLAEVSPASASRFLSALEEGGYLDSRGDRLKLVRHEALFSAWRSASQRPLEERPARFLLPSSDPLRRLREVLAAPVRRRRDTFEEHWSQASDDRIGEPGERACLALFSACHALDVGFVRGAPLHVYSEDLSPGFLKELQLQVVGHPAEADLFVRKPRFPESVFRACVVDENVPAADIVQCWLDVASHPARGDEQADEIADRLDIEGLRR